MMKQTIIIFLSLIMSPFLVGAQSYSQQFDQLVFQKDTLGQQRLLEKWDRENENDPELFSAYLKFYVYKSRKIVLRTDSNALNAKPIEFIYYDPELLDKGFNYAKLGIAKYPDRIDYRFGRIFMMGQIRDYEAFTMEIIQTLDRSLINDNQWLWKENAPLDYGEGFMLKAIESYQQQLYDSHDDSLMNYIVRIANAVLKSYPSHKETVAMLGKVSELQDFLVAETRSPQNPVILNNIAHAYKLKGDKEKAKKYFGLVMKYGDATMKKAAEDEILQLIEE